MAVYRVSLDEQKKKQQQAQDQPAVQDVQPLQITQDTSAPTGAGFHIGDLLTAPITDLSGNTSVEKPGHNSKEVRKSPKTGDENRMDLWLVMLCVFGIAVVTEIVIYKRRNR